jgi:hypothetical protein
MSISAVPTTEAGLFSHTVYAHFATLGRAARDGGRACSERASAALAAAGPTPEALDRVIEALRGSIRDL